MGSCACRHEFAGRYGWSPSWHADLSTLPLALLQLHAAPRPGACCDLGAKPSKGEFQVLKMQPGQARLALHVYITIPAPKQEMPVLCNYRLAGLSLGRENMGYSSICLWDPNSVWKPKKAP